MTATFKTIGIIGRLKNEGVKETLRTLVDFLTQIGQNLIIEAETADSLENSIQHCVAREDLGSLCDLIIVVGGDGSLLSAAHAVIPSQTPVLGINRGSLGFLTDILPTELEKIKAILDGEFIVEKRFLLSAKVMTNNQSQGTGDALNEIALIPYSAPHMLEFEIYVDDKFVCSQNSDGLIMATPTGSTAYALSGGGPILHPQLDAIVIVPMFPHTLSSRPIVIEGNRQIKIIVSPNNTCPTRISCDAQNYIDTPAGSHITVQKKDKLLHLIHPLDYNYYETLRSKLHWGKKLHYSS